MTTEADLSAKLEAAEKERDELRDQLEDKGCAATEAFDAIAETCGCKDWEYPGQIVRDVEGLKKERDAALAERVRQTLLVGLERGQRENVEAHLRDLEEKARAVVDGVAPVHSSCCNERFLSVDPHRCDCGATDSQAVLAALRAALEGSKS